MFRPNRTVDVRDQAPPHSGSTGNLAALGSSGVSLLSSGGRAKAPDLTGRSSRAHTVPLQMVLRSRHQMSEQGMQVNSYEAIDAMEKAVRPISYGGSKAQEASVTVQSERAQTQLRRGSISNVDYMKTVVFKVGTDATSTRLIVANSFEVLGGVSEVRGPSNSFQLFPTPSNSFQLLPTPSNSFQLLPTPSNSFQLF